MKDVAHEKLLLWIMMLCYPLKRGIKIFLTCVVIGKEKAINVYTVILQIYYQKDNFFQILQL